MAELTRISPTASSVTVKQGIAGFVRDSAADHRPFSSGFFTIDGEQTQGQGDGAL
ncbi:MAG: hypothetical protein U0798_01835 [Gemmataceae bacterium]